METKMQDSSSFLNLPGLKYLQKDSSVDWNSDSSSYLSYDGLKRMDRGRAFTDSSKEFLSEDGLRYMLYGKFSKIIDDKKKKEDEARWYDDSSLWFEYDPSTGEVIVYYDEDNESIYTADENPATVQTNGNLSLLVYEGRGLDVSIWIEPDGIVKIESKE